MAAITITVAIEKGGCGKTVTTVNFADLMGDEGKKVLCVDTDPQGNLTYSLTGARITDSTFDGKGLYDLYNSYGFRQTKDYITETNLENVDLIPANKSTPRIQSRLKDLLADSQNLEDGNPAKMKEETEFLKYFISQVKDDYDFILIDTQPSRDSTMVMSAMVAADYILIPMVCGAYAIDSAFRTYSLCNKMREAGICAAKGIGVMLTMVQRSAASDKARKNCQEVLGATLFATEIRFGKSVEASVLEGIPVVEYAKTQPPAKSYIQAYAELKEKLGV